MQFNQALMIANNKVLRLKGYCSAIDIAGSLRRRQPVVGDIEILCRPQNVQEPGLFGAMESRKRMPAFIVAVESLGKIVSGDVRTGRYLKIMLAEEIQLDLFIPQPHDYYRQLAIRTGSKDFAHQVIARAWNNMGWCGTEDGLRRITECYQERRGDKIVWKCAKDNPTLPKEWQSERDFFAWLGLPWTEPHQREITTSFAAK